MAKAFKGTLGLMFGIENINRKIALRSEKAGSKTLTPGNDTKKHVGGAKYMGGFTRTYNVVTGSGKRSQITTQYCFVKKYGRSTPLSTNEVNLRNAFRTISKAVPEIMEDLTQVTRIQSMWKQACADSSKKLNGVSAVGYSSIRDWVFGVQYAGKKKSGEYNVETFPSTFDA